MLNKGLRVLVFRKIVNDLNISVKSSTFLTPPPPLLVGFPLITQKH